MKQSSYKGKSPLPDFVIDAACAGNAEAVERVLQHYDGYINKLCTRTLYDDCGQLHVCVSRYCLRIVSRLMALTSATSIPESSMLDGTKSTPSG